jgi:APA family basic amino acid/polyamine antiporter
MLPEGSTVRRITLFTATCIVIANMVGTGVFTSLGFQVGGIQSPFALIMLWIVGGIIALCGALSYGELAAAMPRSGGEYHYLSRIYHPVIGFMSGWVSALVGFAAPVALAAMALGAYATRSLESGGEDLPERFPQYLAGSVVILLTAIHSYDIKAGSLFQNVFTTLKVVLIILFIALGFFYFNQPQDITFMPVSHDNRDLMTVLKGFFSGGLVSADKRDWTMIFSSSFAISLVYVSYAYSGWNASAYMAGEIENPKKNLPRSLIQGTFIVMILYVLLNAVFMHTVPLGELENQLEVGYISANKIFGPVGGNIMGLTIALLLVSTVSSMIFAGPRVAQVMGEDLSLLRILSVKNRKGIPVNAILLQGAISLIFIFTSSFEYVLTYIGFTLYFFTFLTVLGVIILRIRHPEMQRPYKTFGYPVVPVLFLLLTGWTMFFIIRDKPSESIAGLLTVATGFVVYLAGHRGSLANTNQDNILPK